MIAQPLFDQFSAASQKYKTGVIRIFGNGLVWEMLLVNGRVIDVVRSEDRDVQELLERLVRTGVIKKQEQTKLAARKITIPELESFLIAERDVSTELLAEMRMHLALDALFEIGHLQDAECEFFFHPARDHKGPGIDVNFGQFLLDVVEYNIDEERVEQIFRSMRRGMQLNIVGDMPERLLPFEQLLLSVVAFPCTYEELHRSQMSRYELVEGVLSLLDQGVLGLEGEESEDYVEEVGEQEEENDEGVDHQTEETEEESDAVASDSLSESGVRRQSRAKPSVLPKAEKEKQRTPKKRSTSGKRLIQNSSADKFLSLNYTLLEEKQLQKVILWTNELFLLAVLLSCLAGPTILDTWFQGLSEFTSSLLSSHGTLSEWP